MACRLAIELGKPAQTHDPGFKLLDQKNAFDLLFGICGRLSVFEVVLKVFALVLRPKLVVNFCYLGEFEAIRSELGVQTSKIFFCDNLGEGYSLQSLKIGSI